MAPASPGCSPTRSLALGALLLLALIQACSGEIGGSGDSGDGGDRPDPSSGDCATEDAELERLVGGFLQTTCSHAGCHGPAGGLAPDLAAISLPELAAEGYVFPGDSSRGRLMARLRSSDPTEAMPPTQAPLEGEPYANMAEVELVARWIDAGAKTGCIEAPPPPPVDPNSHDQGVLFTCSMPTSFAPRYRRLGSPEWVHAFGGHLQDDAMLANPLADARGPYSTYAREQSLQSASLALYVDSLTSTRRLERGETDGVPWLRDQTRWYAGSVAAEMDVACITERDVEPSAVDGDCRKRFIDALLRRVLSRAPTADEGELLGGFVDGQLASEAPAERHLTLRRVYEAAFLLPGALFQSEGDGPGLLSPDAYAQVLASALTTHPASGIVNGYGPRPELGWLEEFRAAQAAGMVDGEAMRATASRVFALANGYVGGEWDPVAPARPDLQNDWGSESFTSENDTIRARRGRFWLAPRIAGFFREYFGYAGIGSLAKVDAAATSVFDRTDPERSGSERIVDWASKSYTLAAGPDDLGKGEPRLDAQLDDAIARMVIEAERGGQDVFSALLTGRTYRVTAAVGGAVAPGTPGECDVELCALRDRPEGLVCCESSRSCVPYSANGDGSLVGICATATWENRWIGVSFPYHSGPRIHDTNSAHIGSSEIEPILLDPTNEARWMTMPEDERSGVLTHPAWLATHGGNEENSASAVLRGHWIREHLFCESVGGLDLVQLAAQLGGTEDDSARQRLDATFGPEAIEPRCSNGACHGLMNSLGLPFEIFNHAGYLRYRDHGAAPNGAATVTRWPGRGDVEVADALELTRQLADDPHARRCFLRHLFRYFVGRDESPADACVLAEMDAAFASGSILAALEALYASDAMLIRSETER